MTQTPTSPILRETSSHPGRMLVADPLGLHGEFLLASNQPYRLVLRGGVWNDRYEDLCVDPERLVRQKTVQVYKVDRRRIVVRAVVDDVGLILKFYHGQRWASWVGAWLFGSAAMQTERGAKVMECAGFRAPSVVAVLETRDRSRSCVISLEIPGNTLEQEWRIQNAAGRLHLVRNFAVYLGELHRSGVYPQDVKSSNFIVNRQSDGWNFCLVDLDRVRQVGTVSRHRIEKNLVQVERSIGREATRGQRLLMLKEYLGPVSRSELHRQARQLLEKARQKEASVVRLRDREKNSV